MPPSYWSRRNKPRPERHGRTSTCRATILGVPANVWRERSTRHVGCTSTCVVPPEPPCWVSRQDTCPKACPCVRHSGGPGATGYRDKDPQHCPCVCPTQEPLSALDGLKRQSGGKKGPLLSGGGPGQSSCPQGVPRSGLGVAAAHGVAVELEDGVGSALGCGQALLHLRRTRGEVVGVRVSL